MGTSIARFFGGVLLVSAAGALALGQGTAQAEPSAADRAGAEALFLDARRLATEGRFVEACPKFAESQRLDPGVGTLLYLAECYEKTARMASAWATFREAADLARTSKQPAREKIALERAALLEPRLAKLLIEVDRGASGVKIQRDGTELSEAVFGTAIPLDQGPHVIVASAPGKKPWTGTVELTEGKITTVKVPPLEDLPPPAATPSAVTPPAASSAPSPPPVTASVTPAPRSPGEVTSPYRVPALVAGGVGVVGLGLGAYFGLRASSLWDQSRENCVGTRCGRDGYDLGTRANNAARASTIFSLLGVAGLGAGATLWFWPGPERSTALRAGPGSVSLEGTW
jgi:serine/threonine-protein kinase